MKNLFKIIAVMALCFSFFNVDAQSTTPRYGTAVGQNKTFGGQSLGFQAITDAVNATADTFVLNPATFQHNVVLTCSDVVCFAVSKKCYVGDNLKIIVNNTAGSGHHLYFAGQGGNASNWQLGSGGADVALTASKSAILTFTFNGAAWVETSRLVQ